MKGCDAGQLTWSLVVLVTHSQCKHLPKSVFLVHTRIVPWVCVCVFVSTAGYTERVAGHTLFYESEQCVMKGVWKSKSKSDSKILNIFYYYIEMVSFFQTPSLEARIAPLGSSISK